MSRVILLLLMVLACAGCAAPRDTGPYPVDKSLTLAGLQRIEFVDSFLQGYWCEAEELYTMSIETAIRTDNFCQAAKTADLAARLFEYAGQNNGQEQDQRDTLIRQALDCEVAGINAPEPKLDTDYRTLTEQKRFAALAQTIEQEQDALYASVYARKGAGAALKAGAPAAAMKLAKLARRVDAAHGWVTFLVLDWKLIKALSTDSKQIQAINERIGTLEQRILACD